MSTLAVNSITDANSGNTATINGMTPTADSLQGFRNRIINGDMRIDQRNAGASVTPTSGSYTLDRWRASLSQTSKFTVQQNAGSITPPSGFINYLGVTSSSSYTVGSSESFYISQRVEGLNCADLDWGTANAQTVTLSFWVRSSLTGSFGAALWNGGANRVYPVLYTINSADTWEQKSITIPGDTSGSWLTTSGVGINVVFGLGFGSSVSGTGDAWNAGTAYMPTGATSVVGTSGATWYITGVQLEVGSVASPFERRPYGTELSLCQRYYYKYINNSGASRFIGPLQAYAAGSAFGKICDLPVEMRSTPTISLSGTIEPLSATASTLVSFTSVTLQSTRQLIALGASSGSSGLTAGNATGVRMTNGVFFDASAEL